MESVDGPTELEQQAPNSKKKRNLWIAGSVAGALVLGGAIATPLVLQGIRDRELAELKAEIGHTYGQIDEKSADREAALALSSLQYTEAADFVQKLGELGTITEPIFSKAQAKGLADAAATASEALRVAPEESEERSAAVSLVESKVAEMKAADADAAAAAKQAKEDAPEATAPASFLAVTIEDVRGMIGEDSGAAHAEPDVRMAKEGDVVAVARAELQAAKADLKEVQGAADAELELSATYTDAVAGTLPALVSAAEGAPAQAKATLKSASKAGDSGTSLMAAAETAKSAAGDDEVTAAQLRAEVAAYVAAAQKAQKAHAKTVANEKAAAAAEEASAGGEYVGGDDTGSGGAGGAGGEWPVDGGGWSPTEPGGGQPPVDTGAGGGGSGAGGSGSGGGAGGSPGSGGGGGAPGGGGSGGGTPPATTCPPGTIPTGSWDNINGVHCEGAGAGGTDTEGWG